jgi:DNA-binding NarL/FixJ family response regulator
MPKSEDPRLRTHSNTARWDAAGYVVEGLRREGLDDTEIARLLKITQRAVKKRRERVAEC